MIGGNHLDEALVAIQVAQTSAAFHHLAEHLLHDQGIPNHDGQIVTIIKLECGVDIVEVVGDGKAGDGSGYCKAATALVTEMRKGVQALVILVSGLAQLIDEKTVYRQRRKVARG
jgi:hypothetical protein